MTSTERTAPPRPQRSTEIRLACARVDLATNLAFLFKCRGGVVVAPIRVRHPLRSAAALVRSKWFAIGWLVAILAWTLHAAALARAPLSIAEALSGRAAAPRRPRPAVGPRTGHQRLDDGGATRPQRSPLAALIAVESAIFAIGAALLVISAHRGVLHSAEGLMLGLAAGARFGVSDVPIKYLTHARGQLHGLMGPWTLTALVAGTIAFYAPAAAPTRARRRGHRLYLVAANLSAVTGGILVFSQPIGSVNRSAPAHWRSARASSRSAW